MLIGHCEALVVTASDLQMPWSVSTQVAKFQTKYRTVKLLEDANFIEKHEFGDGRARYEESGKHHEHLIDVETGEVIEFIDDELEQLKERIAIKMGYELVDHRLELFGKKLKIN